MPLVPVAAAAIVAGLAAILCIDSVDRKARAAMTALSATQVEARGGKWLGITHRRSTQQRGLIVSDSELVTAKPIAGHTPLEVEFTIRGAGQYTLEFGDSSSSDVNTINSQPWVRHTYIESGVYSAQLRDQQGVVATVTITVQP